MKGRNLVGLRFGFSVVLEDVGRNKHGGKIWKCLCDCGNFFETTTNHLTSGDTKSCGCYNKSPLSKASYVHGKHNSPEKRSYQAMKMRCLDKEDREYHRYGGRGITVCERWLNSFENFLEDMGERPEGMTLDRIDNNFHYCPENCRWADKTTQSYNQRLSSDNKSGRTGVLFIEKSGKWRARLQFKNKLVLNKLFDSFNEALEAREKAEEIFYGYKPN